MTKTYGLSQFNKLTLVGSCDWVTDCSCCGKERLKRTFVFKEEEGDFHFFGSSCAKKVSPSFKSTFDKSSNKPPVQISRLDKILEIEVSESKYRLTISGGAAQTVEIWNPYKEQWQSGYTAQLRVDIHQSGEHKEILAYL